MELCIVACSGMGVFRRRMGGGVPGGRGSSPLDFQKEIKKGENREKNEKSEKRKRISS